MAKKNSDKKKDNKKHSSIRKNRIISKITFAHKKEGYKSGLLQVDKQEEKYNKLFEQKLSEQYREFRNIKDHNLQLKKFLRIFGVIIVIILVAVLLLSFS
jgi:hypothetical protein